MKIEIFVRFQFEGIHCWPECSIEQVSFLQNPHRHVFHVEARKVVSHENRDVEFILLKRDMMKHCSKWPLDLGSQSCEQIAIHLFEVFKLSSCSVSEDGENGSIVTI